MKKITYVIFILFLLIGIASPIYAQMKHEKNAKKAEANLEIIKGKIVSVDAAKNEIVLKEKKTGVIKTIAVSPEQIASLKSDEDIKVTLKAGSSTAESIKHVVKNPKPVKK